MNATVTQRWEDAEVCCFIIFKLLSITFMYLSYHDEYPEAPYASLKVGTSEDTDFEKEK